MSTLRQAAQQSLEALDCPGKAKTDDEQAAITALRAALAEPQTTHWEGCETVHPECKVTPRRPLTDEELRGCFTCTNTAEPLAEGWPGLERFARAIERAHGITGETNV